MKKLILACMLLLLFIAPVFAEPISSNDSDKIILAVPASEKNGGYYIIKSTMKVSNLSPEHPSVLQFSYIEYQMTKAEKYDFLVAKIQDHSSLDGWDKLESTVYTVQLDLKTNELRYLSVYFYSKDKTLLGETAFPEEWIKVHPNSIGYQLSAAAAKSYYDSNVGTLL
jgi:hypothetical protein